MRTTASMGVGNYLHIERTKNDRMALAEGSFPMTNCRGAVTA